MVFAASVLRKLILVFISNLRLLLQFLCVKHYPKVVLINFWRTYFIISIGSAFPKTEACLGSSQASKIPSEKKFNHRCSTCLSTLLSEVCKLDNRKIRVKNLYRESLWSPQKKCHDLGKYLQSSIFHKDVKQLFGSTREKGYVLDFLKNNWNKFRNIEKLNLIFLIWMYSGSLPKQLQRIEVENVYNLTCSSVSAT